MQRRNRVGATRDTQSKDGHAEIFVAIAWIFAADLHQPIVRQAETFAQRTKMLLNQIAAESIVTSGNRRVRREHYLTRNVRKRSFKTHAFFLHAIVNRFEHHESAVAFVQMQHAGRNAHRFQCAETAHSE